jgi:hypothetical protein
MSDIRVHGINLVGTIENLSVESLASDPSYTTEGFVWYDSVDKALKGTVKNAEDSLVIERLVDSQYLTDAQNLFESKLPVQCVTSETIGSYATRTINSSKSDGDLYLVSNTPGLDGNKIYFQVNNVAPTNGVSIINDSPSVGDTTISYTPRGNTSMGSLLATASEATAFLMANPTVASLVTITYEGTGTGIITNGNKGYLSGGADFSVSAFPDTIDGYALSVGDRILVKDAIPATNNGIYVVDSDNGDGTIVISRSEDADNNPGGGEVVSGIFTMVNEGTNNGGTMWILRTANPITLGTTDLTWEQVSGVGDFVAGTGISKSGVTMSAILDGSTLIDTGSGVIGVDTSLVPTSILTMTDVPNAFTNVGDVLRVNATADALEFYNPKDSVLEFTDAPSSFGSVGYSLMVNGTGDGYVYADPTTNLQSELDVTQTGLGLNADGTYTSPGGTYISSATSILNSITMLDSTLANIYTNANGSVYTEETSTASLSHTITHNLGTENVFATVWVYNTSDSAYHLDAVDFSIDSANAITVNLGVSENIKVIVRSAEAITA